MDTTKLEALIYDNVSDIAARNELLVAVRRDAARIAELEAALVSSTELLEMAINQVTNSADVMLIGSKVTSNRALLNK